MSVSVFIYLLICTYLNSFFMKYTFLIFTMIELEQLFIRVRENWPRGTFERLQIKLELLRQALQGIIASYVNYKYKFAIGPV